MNYLRRITDMLRGQSGSLPLECHALPKLIEIEPVNTCNLRCRMCHYSFMPREAPQHIDPDLLSGFGSMSGTWIKIGSNFEPFMHPKIDQILGILAEKECRIDLTTNATLVTPEITDRIAGPHMEQVTVSFDSIHKPTYESIRRRADYEKTLEHVLYLRNHPSMSKCYFAINAVLCRSNVKEIRDMIDFWDARKFHQIRFIFMVIRSLEEDCNGDNDLIHESLYPIRDVAFRALDLGARHLIESNRRITLNCTYYRQSKLLKTYPNNIIDHQVQSDNPQARPYFNPGHHFQKGSHPDLKVNCLSPFTFAKILSNGDVQLCYRFTIGNLYRRSLEDIWNGEQARRTRQHIVTNPSDCMTCDYYRFCLNSDAIDINDKVNYFQQDLIGSADSMWNDDGDG